MKKKVFKYKGQQVNYYNKVKQNDKIDMVIAYLKPGEGYVVEWWYKR